MVTQYSVTTHFDISFDGQMSSWQITSVAKTPTPIITG